MDPESDSVYDGSDDGKLAAFLKNIPESGLVRSPCLQQQVAEKVERLQEHGNPRG